MKAVLMTQTGSATVLEIQEVKEPQITQPNELKIRVRAAGVNPLDVKLRDRGHSSTRVKSVYMLAALILCPRPILRMISWSTDAVREK